MGDYVVGDNAMMLSSCGQQFHCILIDPPTGCSPKQRGRADVAAWDNPWSALHWTEVAAAAKATLLPGGSVIVFVGSLQGEKSQNLGTVACNAFKGIGFDAMTLYWFKRGFKG